MYTILDEYLLNTSKVFIRKKLFLVAKAGDGALIEMKFQTINNNQ